MLVLTRKEGEQIRIGEDVIVTVVRVSGDKIRIGIEAPAQTLILRNELRANNETIPQKTEGCVFDRVDQNILLFEVDAPGLAASHCS